MLQVPDPMVDFVALTTPRLVAPGRCSLDVPDGWQQGRGAFGGPGLEHLFVTSIPPAAPVDGFDAALDGAVLLLPPAGRGLAEVPFRT